MSRYTGSTKSHSLQIAAWNALPVIIRAVLTGFFITIAGTLPWAKVVKASRRLPDL